MKLASLFQNGAVFQRNATIPVWGKTAPNVNVCGKFNGTEVFSCSSSDGDFTLFFPEQSAGGPFTLEVTSPAGSVTVNDIYVGEVWLASGQSNMQYQLHSDWRADTTEKEIPLSREQEKEFFNNIDRKNIFRFFQLPQNASGADEISVNCSWKDIAPECSAVAAWFGLYLQKNLNIPVGLIVSAWGGTIAEAWMSYPTLVTCPETRDSFSGVVSSHKIASNYDVEKKVTTNSLLNTILRPDTENVGEKRNFHLPEFNDSDWKPMHVPGSWIKQHIAGNGAVWIRKSFSIPDSWVGKELTFCSGGIDKQDITYCNGVKIGFTGEGLSLSTYNLPRRYTIPAELVSSPELHLAVRAYSACYDGSFGGNWILKNNTSGEELSIAGDWLAGVELDLGTVSPKRNASLYGRGNPNSPGILFNSMIKPLIPYAIAGTIWYQGESNAGTIALAEKYYGTLKALISDWRRNFLNPEMPFIMVQLAGYGEYSPFDIKCPWPVLRESQRKLANDCPCTGMATAIDCGEHLDIHPQDKESVGYRLAAYALNKVYHLHDITPNGPELLRTQQTAPGVVVLDFAQAKNMYINDEADQSFYLSENGEDFYPADSASVDGSSVKLVSNTLKNIKSIRYAWSDFPASTLYNGDGFPASSFAVEL